MAAASSFEASTSGSPASPQMHLVGDFCPLCDQAIPHDRFDEIQERMRARERATADAVEARLHDEHARATAEAVEVVRREAAANEAAIRDDATRSALASANEQRAALEQAHRQAQTTLLERLSNAETIAHAAQTTEVTLRAQLEQVQQAAVAQLESVQADAARRELAARSEGSRAAHAALEGRIAEVERGKAEAEARATVAEQAAKTATETQEAHIAARVREVRSAMEVAQNQAVNAVRSESYEQRLKLSEKVTELQRALEKKTADELGEGAEIDLIEVLKGEFKSDRIQRVGKGRPGADIIHTVIQNGKERGKIIYDSKDHSAWRNDFVTKLASDKIAEKAEHAVLSVRKFPQGVRQLHVQDGVILANPARILALVQILREHILRTDALRLSNDAKAKKSAELYRFITSPQCTDLLNRIDTQAQDLLDMQLSEKRSHENMWKRQGALYRSIQKAQADLVNRIEIIIGTADPGEQAVNDE
jgi:hypothetical protein